MQGLLARLSAVRAQNSDSVEQSRMNVDGLGNTEKISINNFINGNESEGVEIGNRNTGVDGLNVPKLSLPDRLSIDNVDKLSEDASTARTSCDDGLVIDIVMASNTGKLSARSARTRSSASTPKPKMKSSSRNVRGSRISLNSNSERDDTSVFADSDDDTVVTGRQCESAPAQAWAAFENAVKNIDNGNPEYFTKKPKPNFISSGTFQKVMVDMYGNTEYGNTKGYTLLKMKLNNMARATTLASRMMSSAVAKGKEEREREEREGPGDDTDECSVEEKESVTKVFAKRGWKLLKRQVHENAMEHNTQATKMNWVMLQHTVKQMSNVERTRQDLYERYGILPTKLEDGRMVCENRMLSERARAQMYGDGKESQTSGQENKRPSSYQPPPVHLRSRSQLSFQKKGRDGLKSGKLPHFGGRKYRPKTAK